MPSKADIHFETITSVPSGEFNSTFILKDGALARGRETMTGAATSQAISAIKRTEKNGGLT